MAAASRPTAGDLVELVRLPAVLSVPGDTLAGAALASPDGRLPPKVMVLPVSSCLLYLAGMALNDYADREVDAIERPHRPIPSGRVRAEVALQLAHGLTVAGIAVSAFAGRRALRVAVLLASAVYAYDLVLKDTPLGPVAMATCRALDVLLGGTAGRAGDAVPGAMTIGAHTALLSLVSGRETAGGSRAFAGLATGGAAAVAGLAGANVVGPHARRPLDAVIPLAVYATSQVRESLRALVDPSPAALQRVVGAGVLAIIPLQAAFLLARGHRRLGAAVAAAWPVARRAARRRAVT